MKRLLTRFTCFIALIGAAHAQIATTTSLVGTVSDSSGKIIAGAKITAVNSETLDTYNAITNQDGNYRIDFVRVGTYNVSCEFAGFHAYSIREASSPSIRLCATILRCIRAR